MAETTTYNRVMLKISGEALMGAEDYGIDPAVITRIAREIMFSLPPATQALILINVIVFFAGAALGGVNLDAFALWPLGSYFMPWQVLTYAFLHGNLTHLLFNMFGLYMFGSDVERVWGTPRFLNYYLICALAGAAAQMLFSLITGAGAPMVGASICARVTRNSPSSRQTT